MRQLVAAWVLLSLWMPICFAESIRIARAENDIGRLPDLLLQVALQRGGKYQPSYPFGNVSRLEMSARLQGLRNGELDLIYALSSAELEKEFRAVYIPIYRGMMGMRVALVRRQNLHQFRDVKTLTDLSKFTAGQGKYWSDSAILEANQLAVVREAKFENLFRMLDAERFHYFPRGIQEPWTEVSAHPELDLAVDPYLLLWYKVPFYFFVSRQRLDLAEHITQQLENMIADGSFDVLFNENQYIKSALSQIDFSKRTILRLDNPFLTKDTPLNRPELWFDPFVQSQILPPVESTDVVSETHP